ncbi:MAG TPA: zinc-binding dehydrogenase [Vicinamibacteria bacterium]|nr:zinc-binding dehydrogenase [Vicinamibacteria bacterium]
MRAIVINRHGGKEVLEPAELPDPVAGPGEAVVRVRACALNRLDVWTRLGQSGRALEFPHVLGSDIAGEVLALGSPAEGITPGQRVLLAPGVSCGRCRMCLAGEDNSCRQYRLLGYQIPGGYAERVRCPLVNLVPLPDHVPFEDAAAFPLVFLTAWRMLLTRAAVRPGEDVLVWAAGSGVGMAAIQVAKRFGARVIATAGTEAKLARARTIGADDVVDHRTGDVVAEVRRLTGKKGVEVVVEHVGKATWERSILALAPRGRLVTCGATTGPVGATDLRYVFSRQLTLMGSYMGSKAELHDAAGLFFAGGLRPVVHAVLPFEAARRAHEMLEASEHFGKIVLRL